MFSHYPPTTLGCGNFETDHDAHKTSAYVEEMLEGVGHATRLLTTCMAIWTPVQEALDAIFVFQTTRARGTVFSLLLILAR